MLQNSLFFDSSALMAGIISSQGAARSLLLLSEDEKITIHVSEQVVTEVERNIARKVPKALPFVREMILDSKLRIQRDPSPTEVIQHLDWISHAADVPILVSAINAKVDYLVTLDSHHFIDDKQVAIRSGLRIGTPSDALAWVRKQLSDFQPE
jgi:putative PIN family toxin of toxin-antitoxin system